MAFSNSEKMAIYEAAEEHNPGYGAVSAVYKVSLGLFEVIMEPHRGGPDLRVMFTRDGVPAGFAGKSQPRRDPEAIQRNRRRKAASAKRKPAIGRRKTVRMSASGLITRRNRKKAKSAMFRMGQKSKLLACHACSRNDFGTEKSLKAHTAKFHTPGQKSPRGFRTKRDSERDSQQGWAVFKGRAMVQAYADKGTALRSARSLRKLDPFGDGSRVEGITVRSVPWAYVRMDKQYPLQEDSYTQLLHREAKRKFRGSGRRYRRDAE